MSRQRVALPVNGIGPSDLPFSDVAVATPVKPLARVYRRPSLQQEDRLPVSTYDEAVWRLVEVRCDETVTDEAYSLAVSLLSDVFWLIENRLRLEGHVTCNQLRV